VPLAEPRPATLIGSARSPKSPASRGGQGRPCRRQCAARTYPATQSRTRLEYQGSRSDRTHLEIFGRRAHTREGVLQVELAHLNIKRAGSSDRGRISSVNAAASASWGVLANRSSSPIAGSSRNASAELKGSFSRQRPRVRCIGRAGRGALSDRRSRRLHQCRQVDIVHALTNANALAETALATLDPAMRAVVLPQGRKRCSRTPSASSPICDHAHRRLPRHTEEVIAADIIVHVRDISHPETESQAGDVARVLAELGISKDDPASLNSGTSRSARVRPARYAPHAIVPPQELHSRLSLEGEGLDALLATIKSILQPSSTL